MFCNIPSRKGLLIAVAATAMAFGQALGQAPTPTLSDTFEGTFAQGVWTEGMVLRLYVNGALNKEATAAE